MILIYINQPDHSLLVKRLCDTGGNNTDKQNKEKICDKDRQIQILVVGLLIYINQP